MIASPEELADLLSVSAYNAYMNTLVGNSAPAVRAYYDRVSKPQIGDVVVEISAMGRKPAEWRVGRLLSVEREPYPDWPKDGDEPIPTREIWTIEKLVNGELFRWENCTFITALQEPVNILDPLKL